MERLVHQIDVQRVLQQRLIANSTGDLIEQELEVVPLTLPWVTCVCTANDINGRSFFATMLAATPFLLGLVSTVDFRDVGIQVLPGGWVLSIQFKPTS